jgi:hypothetical protein
MKKSILALILMTIGLAHGAVLTPNAKVVPPGPAGILFSTFSFPTLLVMDKEVQLSSEEAGLIILSEAVSDSDNDPVSNIIKIDNNKILFNKMALCKRMPFSL